MSGFALYTHPEKMDSNLAYMLQTYLLVHTHLPEHAIHLQSMLSLCLNKHYAIKKQGVEEQLHAFLTSALDGGEWSDSCPSCLTLGGMALETHWV
jgi:hypothetical protein